MKDDSKYVSSANDLHICGVCIIVMFTKPLIPYSIKKTWKVLNIYIVCGCKINLFVHFVKLKLSSET